MGQAASLIASATRSLGNLISFITGAIRVPLAVSGVLLASTPIIGPVILGGFGFTAIGPAAGSLAALWQASIGNVIVGSSFAWCQSAAMGGAAAGGFNVAGAAGAAILGSAAVR